MPARGRWITLGLSSSSGGLGVAVNLWGFSLTPGLSCPSPPQSPRSQNCLFFFFQGKSIREFSSRRLSSQKPLVSKTWQTRDGGADSFPRGCHNRFLQTGWLRITETYSLLVWRPGAWNQGIRRVGSFWSSEGESVQYPPHFWRFSATTSVFRGLQLHHTELSASVFTGACFICSLGPLFLLGHQSYWVQCDLI